MLLLGWKVERELDTAKALKLGIGEHLGAETVRGNAGDDAPTCQKVQDGVIVGMEAIFSNSQIHRLHRDAVAHPLNILQAQALDDHIRAIAMGAPEIAVVGQTDADGEGHASILLWG